jgi:ribonuclease P protein component
MQRGKRVEQPSLVVLWRRWDGPRQVGFAVSRQVRGAVSRNRARRWLREAYRASREGLPPGVQLVCVAREAAARGSFEALHRDMKEALAFVARQLRAAASP